MLEVSNGERIVAVVMNFPFQIDPDQLNAIRIAWITAAQNTATVEDLIHLMQQRIIVLAVSITENCKCFFFSFENMLIKVLLYSDRNSCFCLFLTEQAWSHGGLRTRELGQDPSHVLNYVRLLLQKIFYPITNQQLEGWMHFDRNYLPRRKGFSLNIF